MYLAPIIQELRPIAGYDGDYLLTPQGRVISFKLRKPAYLKIQTFKRWVARRKYHREKYIQLSKRGKTSTKSINYLLHKTYPERFGKMSKEKCRRYYLPFRDFMRKMGNIYYYRGRRIGP